jgi:aspartate kinase
MKFGGTSVEDARAFERVAYIVRQHTDSRPVVVVSAMSRMTDALLASLQAVANHHPTEILRNLDVHFQRHSLVARSLLPPKAVTLIEAEIERTCQEIGALLELIATHLKPSPILQDQILFYGEHLSAMLLTAVFLADGLAARYVDARRCIVTNEEHGRAVPVLPQTKRKTRAELMPLIEAAEIPVLGGFIAASSNGATTTLGRGGSDYTATLISAVLEAREVQIWTDVAGVLTADPRLVKEARTIPSLSYAEASALAGFGVKRLHAKTFQPLIQHRIPLRICNSHAPEQAGTAVFAATPEPSRPVKAIMYKPGTIMVHLTFSHGLDSHDSRHTLFNIIDRYRPAVNLMTSSEISMSFLLTDTSALSAIKEELRQFGTVLVDKPAALIGIVGEGLRQAPGIAARVFHALDDINVLFMMPDASNISLILGVEEERMAEAIRRLHNGFLTIAERVELPSDAPERITSEGVHSLLSFP